MTDETPSTQGQRSLAESALLGLCPACGARTLFSRVGFSGVVRFSDRCGKCGLDYSAYNVGDGPAALLIMLVGAIVVTGAVSLQLSKAPPFWVHIVLWVPISSVLVIGLLRVAKAAMLITEHRRQASEGRIEE